ncbi:HalOD1 output domain-containing protein [Halorubrum aquaticum]|uniref:HalOD1 output domain-containing protein n=1 Tax=Halorubrum aquaticum TaxID=387340 RepID=UPI00122D2047|nr:HalOD1 output domain-containing protein [Halorubrum aquaticum]
METETSATVAVVRAVAEAEDASPGDLPLLSDVIDPEAFDDLFDDDRVGRSGVSLSFDYCGYVVTVTDDAVTLDAR